MTDDYTYSSDSRLRRQARIDYSDGRGREISVAVEEPNAEQVTELLGMFLRLCQGGGQS